MSQLQLTHAFVSGLADDPAALAAGEVCPQSHWNAVHSVELGNVPSNAVLYGALNGNSSFTTDGNGNVATTGKVLVGYGTDLMTEGLPSVFQTAVLESPGNTSWSGVFSQFWNSPNGPAINITKSRGSSLGQNVILQSGDHVGYIGFDGADGSGYSTAAFIQVNVDGTPSLGIMPGRFSVYTGNTAGGAPERLRIDSTGLTTLFGTLSATGIKVGADVSGGTATSWINVGTPTVGGSQLLLGKDYSSTYASRIDITSVGGTTSDAGGAGFWRGLHLGAPLYTISSVDQFTRTSLYFEYDTLTDPTSRIFAIDIGNLNAGGAHTFAFRQMNDTMLTITPPSGAISGWVNYIDIVPVATGNLPTIRAVGSDTNVGLALSGKGASGVSLWNNGNTAFLAQNNTSSPTNYVYVNGSAASAPPTIGVNGSDTNIDIAFAPKGSGIIYMPCGVTMGGTSVNVGSGTVASINALYAGLYNSGRLAIGWNYSSGLGETDFFINSDGGAPGGLNIYNFPNSSTGTIDPLITISGPAGSVNYLSISAATTGNALSLTANGGDAHVGMNFFAKGNSDFGFFVNGVAQLEISGPASACNLLNITGNTTGFGPNLYATGTDTNVDINIVPQNAGAVNLYSNAAVGVVVANPASTVNHIQMGGSVTGNGVYIEAAGTDTNIALFLEPKGSGSVVASTTNLVIAAGTASATLQMEAGTSQQATVLYQSNGVTQWQAGMQAGGTQWFLYDAPNATSPIAVNGGTTKTIQLGYFANQGTLGNGIGNVLISGGYVTPQMYGCVGDGATDDTANLSTCLNSGKPVLLIGRFRITSQITVTLSISASPLALCIIGGGGSVSQIICDNALAGVTVNIPYNGNSIYQQATVVLRDFNFVMKATGIGSFATLDSTTGVITAGSFKGVLNLIAQQVGGAPFIGGTDKNFSIKNVGMTSDQGQGVGGYAYCGIYIQDCRGFTVDEFWTGGNWGNAANDHSVASAPIVYHSSSLGTQGNAPSPLNFVNCNITGGYYGICVVPSGNTNYATQGTNDWEGLNISGCTIIGCARAIQACGSDGSSNGAQICNNDLEGVGYGAYLYGVGGICVTNNIIVITGVGAYGVYHATAGNGFGAIGSIVGTATFRGSGGASITASATSNGTSVYLAGNTAL